MPDPSGYKLHRLLEKRFGSWACEKSHQWIKQRTGKCHVSQLTIQEKHRLIKSLEAKLHSGRKVRPQTWKKLSEASK